MPDQGVRAAQPMLAQRLARVQTAATIAISARAREMRARGIAVISLAIGQPDFPTPDHAIAAAHQAALAGDTKYPPIDGTPALKAAIARKFARENGLEYGPAQIMAANGGKQVIYNAFMATIDAGDEVIVPAPYWGAYVLMARLAGADAVVVNCPQNNGFKLRPEDLEAAITPRTKWLILNFPNNPTGAACSAAEMAALAEVMRRHPQVWIMSDDMYEHLVFGGFQHATMAAVAPDLADRVLTVSGVSKTYAMTGWRVGFCGGPARLIAAMVNIQGQATSGISTTGQAAAVAALDGPQDLVAERAAIYQRRRDLVVDALNAVPGISCHRPEGAFYVYPDIAGCLGRISAGGQKLRSDEDFAAALLDEQHVAVVHGAAFGMSPYIRISYATDEASLAEACRRIHAFCAGLRDAAPQPS